MKTNIEEARLAIISDLHLGNPFCRARSDIVRFLSDACDQGISVCINGDGLDIAQTSVSKLAREVPEVFQQLSRLSQNGMNVYYVVGNHDLVLEHFIEAWGLFTVVPFLNLRSGNKRIRIEHGHIYDPFFVHRPGLYEFATWAAGLVLNIHPGAYWMWLWFERLRTRIRSGEVIIGGSPAFVEAARMLCDRGFDVVAFGHTHHAELVELVELGESKTYVNSGSWLLRPNYIWIEDGEVSVEIWQRQDGAAPPPINPVCERS